MPSTEQRRRHLARLARLRVKKRTPRRPTYKWTDEHDAMVRTMFNDGATGEVIAATINKEFGTHYSVHAVLQHAVGMGLKRKLVSWRPGVDWTPDMNAILRGHIDDHKPWREIASLMGLSYGAVNKQIHVLGIKVQRGKRVSAEERLATMAATAERRMETWRTNRLDKLLNFVPGEYRCESPLPIGPDPVTNPLNLTLMELRQKQCKWIANDDLTAPLYCGHPTSHGSWCEKHHDVVTA